MDFIHLDIQTPKIFRVPMNHSAGIGSNATFHCTASGYPKPTITWAKDNDTNILQSNSRVKVDTNLQKGHSQLVIAGVKNEDYGAYRCVASNRAGSRTSTAARLYPKTLKTIGERLKTFVFTRNDFIPFRRSAARIRHKWPCGFAITRKLNSLADL